MRELWGHFIGMSFRMLGPIGIKMCQMLAKRHDIFSSSICEILDYHSNRSPRLSRSEEKLIRSRIPDTMKNIKQLGSGCIAITYKADMGDKEVVLKMKRPFIEETIQSSIWKMRILLKILPFGINLEKRLLKIIPSLLKQTDFIHEMKVLDSFYELNKDDHHIRIPEVYPEYCTEDMIVQEYICKTNEGNERGLQSLSSFFWRTFLEGHWHADLHPGNVLFLDKGQVGIIDFGLTGRDFGLKHALLINYTYAILDKDWTKAAHIFMRKIVGIKDDAKQGLMSEILESNLNKECPNFWKCTREIDEFCEENDIQLEDNFVEYELAFCTFWSTIVSLSEGKLDFYNLF